MASIKLKPKARNGNIDIKLLIKHPMETGLRKSKGKLVPANHITNMHIEVNGKTVMSAYWKCSI
jgi:sulfur-oxidizing protein SoxZ